MDNRFVPLRPAISSTDDSSNSTVQTCSVGSEAKRRRVGVSVACEPCRKKKIRCDGQRPVCHQCHERAQSCAYRTEPQLAKESARRVVEVVHLLNAMPKEEAIRVLSFLKNHNDAAVVLSVLRGGMEAKQRPSDIAVATAVIKHSFQFLELEAQNPVAYPTLPPIQVDIQDDGALRRLVQPQGVGSPEPSNAISTQQGLEWPRSPQTVTLGFSSDLCDARLNDLDIQHWTNVQINNKLAAKVISLYLETDHPLLGHFDPDLFVSDLVNKKDVYCSRLLVNALLYWACQMYNTIDDSTYALANQFCKEAESVWEKERGKDTLLNMAGLLFLSLSFLGQGKDHAVLAFLAEATDIGIRLGLFGTETESIEMRLEEMTPEARSATSYTAWGVFNYIVLISLFYHQPGIECPRFAPRLPLPGNGGSSDAQDQAATHYMGKTLPHLCRFMCIMHEVCMVYYSNNSPPARDGDTALLRFAEFKFRELLAWSNSLPSNICRGENNAHHILILHIWFHAAVLDIFRPYLNEPSLNRLKTFSSADSSPDAVFAASVNQLKRLIIIYRVRYSSSAYSILWHTALTYVANAVLHQTGEENWYYDFLVCIYGYEGLRRSWRVTEAITRGLLSMALRNGDISSDAARKMVRNSKNHNLNLPFQDIRAPFMLDLNLAMSDPKSATAEELAGDFEENAAFKDYTNIFDGGTTE